jgi:putative hydrolase
MAFVADPDQPNPPDLSNLFSEVPLFREIQRVLLAGAGPVNWELARQVGIAMASWGKDDPALSPEDLSGFEETVRAAELQIAEFTGLPAPAGVARIETVRRAQWVEANIEGLRPLVEPVAAKIADAVAKTQAESAPAEAQQFAGEVMGQISPLLLGAQVGMVLGYLGQRVLGQYDVAVPRPGGDRVLFVVPNIAEFERDWSISPVEFRAWVALHEMTHRFEFARPWVWEHFRTLVHDYVSTMEIDLGGLHERLERMDIADPEGLSRLFESDEGLFGTILDDEQRLKLARIQAFMSAAEGYGEHVTESVGRRMLASHARIEEAVSRRREGETDEPFGRLLGIELKREQYRSGKAFCDRVVELTDEQTLSRMWDSAETLPSQPEIDEPRLWLARMA